MHDTTSGARASQERRAMPGDARGCAVGRSEAAGEEIFARGMVAGLAGGSGDVCVYVFARGPSSGANYAAGAFVGIPLAGEGLGGDLVVGEFVEGGGVGREAQMTAIRCAARVQVP